MKVAVMGYGTVGSGVCEVIETHQDTLAKRTGGKALELARILDLREFPGDKHEALFTKDPTRSWWRKRDRSCWPVPKPTT